MTQDHNKPSTGSEDSMTDVPEELRTFKEELLYEIKSHLHSFHREIRDEIAAIREETKADIRALRDELTTEIKSALSGSREPERGASLREIMERISALEQQQQQQQRLVNSDTNDRSDHVDSRSRRSLRIVGVAEGTEGAAAAPGDLVCFVEKFLSEVLGAEHFGDRSVPIDRVYKIPAPKSKKHINKPRTLVVELIHDTDARKILKLARKKEQLVYNGHLVHIIPDITTENGFSGDSLCTDEQEFTYSWIQTNLEQHPDFSIPKQVVYDAYRQDCGVRHLSPLSVSTFGKIIKDVFPNVQARRLGGRGQSKYCYSGVRRRTKRRNIHIYSSDEEEDEEELMRKKFAAQSDEDGDDHVIKTEVQ